MTSMSDPVGHPSLETTQTAPVVGLEPDPVIDEYARGYEAVGRDVEALVRGLSDAQLNWRPSDGRWSIAECIEHLTVTGTLYLAPLDRAIDHGTQRALFGGRDYQPGWFDRWMIGQMEPPPRRKMRAPGKIRPPQRVAAAVQVIAEFSAVQRALIERVRRATALDLTRVKLRSPIVPLLRMSLGTWLGFILAHERRHLWQARQVRQELRFPS